MTAKGFVIAMGVSGLDKSTVARELAAGRPLNDEMRLPRLRSLADAALAEAATGRGSRDPLLISAQTPISRLSGIAAFPILFLHLAVSRQVIHRRLLARSAHLMPASLLASQFADLERPAPVEPAVEIDMPLPPSEILRLDMEAIAKL